MGVFVNGAVTRIGAWAATVVVLTLNFFLIVQTFGVAISRIARRAMSARAE